MEGFRPSQLEMGHGSFFRSSRSGLLPRNSKSLSQKSESTTSAKQGPGTGCASPAELVDQIGGSLAGGAPTTAQTHEEVRGGEWEVKRDDTRSTPECAAPLGGTGKGGGGAHEVRTYYGTAAAKMIADRLGKHLTKFLALADKVDPADIIDHLRASAAALAAVIWVNPGP